MLPPLSPSAACRTSSSLPPCRTTANRETATATLGLRRRPSPSRTRNSSQSIRCALGTRSRLAGILRAPPRGGLDARSICTEHLDELRAELVQIIRLAAGDQTIVDHYLFVLPLTARITDVGTEAGP